MSWFQIHTESSFSLSLRKPLTIHDRYERTTQRTNGTLTHRVSSTGTPQPDGVLNNTSRIKVRFYRQLYTDRSDPIVFLQVTVSTLGRVYDDFVLLIFLHAHHETSILPGELPEESDDYSHRFVYRIFGIESCNFFYYCTLWHFWAKTPKPDSFLGKTPIPEHFLS